jgi:hypothetical protein
LLANITDEGRGALRQGSKPSAFLTLCRGPKP